MNTKIAGKTDFLKEKKGLKCTKKLEKCEYSGVLNSYWLHDVSIISMLACKWLRRERREQGVHLLTMKLAVAGGRAGMDDSNWLNEVSINRSEVDSHLREICVSI